MRELFRESRHDPIWIFTLAVVVRAWFLIETRSDAIFSILVIDAESYFDLATRIAAGDRFGDQALWFAPFYPYFLAGWFGVFGPDPWPVRLLQHALGAGTAVLTCLLARRFGRGAGWIAGVLTAVSPVLVFYETQLLYTSFAVFFCALFLWLLLRELDGGHSPRSALLSGVALGLLALVRTNSLLFLPVAGVLIGRGGRWRRALWLVVGVALTFTPVLLRNGIAAGVWTPLTVNGGMIFATGFASDSVGGRAWTRTPDDFAPHGAFHREAEQASGRSMSLAEASAYHRARALGAIREDPVWAAGLTLRKLGLLLSSEEVDDNLGIPTVRDRALSLRWMPAPWALSCLLAVLGSVLLFRDRTPAGRDARALTLFALTYGASLLLFFVTARYRLPLVVPAAVLAGAGVFRVRDLFRQRRKGRVALAVGVVALVAVPVFRDPGVRSDPALEMLAVGSALAADGRYEESLRWTERSIQLDPNVAGAHQNRAVALLGLGRSEEALQSAGEATRLDPDLLEGWMTQGAILARRGDVSGALPAFRRAAEIRPDSGPALGNLAQALAETGSLAEAIEVGERADALGVSRLGPLLAEWRNRLAREESRGPRGDP